MYDTWLTPWHTEIVTNWDYTSHFCNTPELPRGGYSTPDKAIEFPWLSLAEYKSRWLLQKGCDNLKNKKRYIETERILFLSHSI